MRLSIALLTLAALALPATAEDPAWRCDSPEAREFDFWIGGWNLVNKGLGQDGKWRVTGTAENRVYPILGGCAIVEHWRGTAWDRKTIGFSVRSWNPHKKKWTLLLSWPAKDRPGFGTLGGTFTHGRGEFFSTFENPAGETVTQRYSFSDIKERTFRWDAANSTDGGVNWNTYWIMEFERRPPTARPLFNGPWIADGRERHCTQPEMAQLDFLAGAWEGVERRPAGDGEWTEHAARVSVVPTLEGCALMEFVEVERGDAGYERFAIRSLVSGETQWVQYELDTDDPVFAHALGTVEGERVVFESVIGPARRVTLERKGDGGLSREDASADADGAWTVDSTLELRPTHYNGRQTERQAAIRGMRGALEEDGLEPALTRYRELHERMPDYVNEAALNAFGYRLMGGGEPALAVKAFEVNVELHPESANAHDSLAESYMNSGRTNSAIEHYERSLELDPENTNAAQMLELMRNAD